MNYDILLSRIEKLSQEKGILKTYAYIQSGVGKDFGANIAKNSKPSIEKIQALATYFGVSIDYLVGNTDYPYIVTAAEMEELKNPNIIRKDIAAFGGAETLTVDSKALDAAIEKALKAKGLI